MAVGFTAVGLVTQPLRGGSNCSKQKAPCGSGLTRCPDQPLGQKCSCASTCVPEVTPTKGCYESDRVRKQGFCRSKRLCSAGRGGVGVE